MRDLFKKSLLALGMLVLVACGGAKEAEKTETAAAPTNNPSLIKQRENKFESVINPILSLEQKFEGIFKEKLMKNEKIFSKIKV